MGGPEIVVSYHGYSRIRPLMSEGLRLLGCLGRKGRTSTLPSTIEEVQQMCHNS